MSEFETSKIKLVALIILSVIIQVFNIFSINDVIKDSRKVWIILVWALIFIYILFLGIFIFVFTKSVFLISENQESKNRQRFISVS